MPIILAIEPDRRQAAHVSAIVRHRVGAELILADTTEAALDAIGSRVPDLVLVPALLSPQDDAALNAALRVIAAAAHVRALTIPVFANGVEPESRGGLLSRWMRGRSDASSDGCDPAVFAEQIKEYLREAAAERAAAVEDEFDPLPVTRPVGKRAEPVTHETVMGVDAFAAGEPFAAREPLAVEEFAAHEPLVEEFTAAPPVYSAEPVETTAHDPYEYVVRPAADAFAAAAREDEAAPQPVAPYEPFVFERAESSPARDYAAPPRPEAFAAPAEPAFEFAFATEPVFAIEPSREIVGADADPEPADETDEQVDENTIVIDLTDDIEEISPEPPAEAVFDGEPMGVYTMPSFDDEPFQIGAEFEARPPAPFEQPSVSRFRPDVIVGINANPTRRFDTHARVEAIPPAEPVLEEFFDETGIVEEFAAAAAAPITDAVATAASVPQHLESWPGEQDVPAPVPKRDDGRVMTGLRSAWAWPTIEGVDVEPPAPLVSLEEFSETLAPAAPAAPVWQPAARPAAAPRPQPVVAAPAKPAAAPAPKPAAAAAAAKPDHMEWAELVASLRQDIERRRNQPAAAASTATAVPTTPRARTPDQDTLDQHTPAPHVAEVPRKRKSTPVQDEWGFFDPQQCGFAALLAKLDEFSEGAEEKDVRQPS
jgi:hypothetical protein